MALGFIFGVLLSKRLVITDVVSLGVSEIVHRISCVVYLYVSIHVLIIGSSGGWLYLSRPGSDIVIWSVSKIGTDDFLSPGRCSGEIGILIGSNKDTNYGI